MESAKSERGAAEPKKKRRGRPPNSDKKAKSRLTKGAEADDRDEDGPVNSPNSATPGKSIAATPEDPLRDDSRGTGQALKLTSNDGSSARRKDELSKKPKGSVSRPKGKASAIAERADGKDVEARGDGRDGDKTRGKDSGKGLTKESGVTAIATGAETPPGQETEMKKAKGKRGRKPKGSGRSAAGAEEQGSEKAEKTEKAEKSSRAREEGNGVRREERGDQSGKRKRGRPRIVRDQREIDNDGEQEDGEEKEDPGKRKRGRPRVVRNQREVDSDGEQENDDGDEEDEEDDEEEDPGKRKRSSRTQERGKRRRVENSGGGGKRSKGTVEDRRESGNEDEDENDDEDDDEDEDRDSFPSADGDDDDEEEFEPNTDDDEMDKYSRKPSVRSPKKTKPAARGRPRGGRGRGRTAQGTSSVTGSSGGGGGGGKSPAKKRKSKGGSPSALPKKGPKFKGWTCPRCGNTIKALTGATYHIVRRVCDKVLEKLRREGKYWDGRSTVVLAPEQELAPAGAFSPDYPDLSMLGLPDEESIALEEKMRLEESDFKCKVCLKTFTSKPGWRYHTLNSVCERLPVESTELVPEDPSTAGGGARRGREDQESRPRRAAEKASAALGKIFSETQGRAGDGSDEGDGDGDVYEPGAAPDEDGEDEGGDDGDRSEGPGSEARSVPRRRGRPRASESASKGRSGRRLRPPPLSREALDEISSREAPDLEGVGGEDGMPGSGDGPQIQVQRKRSWRELPAFRLWAGGVLRQEGVGGPKGDGGGGGGGERCGSKDEGSAETSGRYEEDGFGEAVEPLASPKWEVTTFSRWKEKARGQATPRPVNIEVISEDCWSAVGIVPPRSTKDGRGSAAGEKKKAEEWPPSLRMRVSPFKSVTTTGSSRKDAPMEVVANVGATVWSIDSLMREDSKATVREGSDGKGVSDPGGANALEGVAEGRNTPAGVAGEEGDMFVALGTGALRHTDEPLDEGDAFRQSSDSSFIFPLLGRRISAPGVLQVWRARLEALRRVAGAGSSTEAVEERTMSWNLLMFGDHLQVTIEGQPATVVHIEATATTSNTKESGGDAMFELAYCIAHDGGGILKCSWAPEGFGSGMSKRPAPGGSGAALGLLAATFNDGSLRVYVCPNPEDVAAAAEADGEAGGEGTGSGDKDGPAVVLTEPVLHVTLKKAEVTCFDWSPFDPSLLLAGATDGSVCIWRIGEDGASSSSSSPSPPPTAVFRSGKGKVAMHDGRETSRRSSSLPLQRFACVNTGSYVPVGGLVRAVAWCPETPEMFASTGAGHLISVWDTSDTFQPISSFPLRLNRCEGANIAWAPGRSGLWVSGTARPFLYFLAFHEGVIREATHTLKRVTGGKSSIGRGAKEDTTPSEDPVWGLHVVRENPRRPPGSVYAEAHLVGWTAPGGQVRVVSVYARESAPEEHHHLSVACGRQLVKRSKRWQRTEFRENRVTHRQEYLLPSDPTASRTDGGGLQGDDGSKSEPFFRLYIGRQIEGKVKIMWREAAAPLPALLNAVHLAHVPAAMGSESDANASDPVEAHDHILVFSGGYSGLLRCSALPRLSNPMDTYQKQMARPNQKSVSSAAETSAASLASEPTVSPSSPGADTTPQQKKMIVGSEAAVETPIAVPGEDVRTAAITPASSRKEVEQGRLGGNKPREQEGSIVPGVPEGSPDVVLGKEKKQKATAVPAATGKKPTEKGSQGEKALRPASKRGADVLEAVKDSRDGAAARRDGSLGIGVSVDGLLSADARRRKPGQVIKGGVAGASDDATTSGKDAQKKQKVLSLPAWAVVPKDNEVGGRRRSSSI